jgi:ribosomal protein L19E
MATVNEDISKKAINNLIEEAKVTEPKKGNSTGKVKKEKSILLKHKDTGVIVWSNETNLKNSDLIPVR